eukprot:Clim_evm3s109 gene=Clim_evmTU3s109
MDVDFEPDRSESPNRMERRQRRAWRMRMRGQRAAGEQVEFPTLTNFSIFSYVIASLSLFMATISHASYELNYDDIEGSPDEVSWLRGKRVVMHMFENSLPLMVLFNAVFCAFLFTGKVVQLMVFGALRTMEKQLLYERLINYCLVKSMFMFAVLSPDLREIFVWFSWLGFMGLLRVLAMMGRDRFEYLSFSPSTTVEKHAKILFLLGSIMAIDMACLAGAIQYISVEEGYVGEAINMFLLLIFEAVTIAADTTQTLIKYGIHLYDLRVDGIWESKGIILYYTDFVADVCAHVMTLLHYMHILILHNFSYTLIDMVLFFHLRVIYNQLSQRFTAHKNYLQAVRNLETKFPDAGTDELAKYDDSCAICRDNMQSAKKLPCGHMFHSSCLRSWLEHVSICPTCRHNLVDEEHQQAQQQATRGPIGAPIGAPARADGNDSDGSESASPARAGAGNQEGESPRAGRERYNLRRWFPISTETRRETRARSMQENEVNHLQQMFPNVPRPTLQSILEQCGSSMAAVEYILENEDLNDANNAASSGTEHVDGGAYVESQSEAPSNHGRSTPVVYNSNMTESHSVPAMLTTAEGREAFITGAAQRRRTTREDLIPFGGFMTKVAGLRRSLRLRSRPSQTDSVLTEDAAGEAASNRSNGNNGSANNASYGESSQEREESLNSRKDAALRAARERWLQRNGH